MTERVSPRKSYQVVARRFRPRDFEDVVGQDQVIDSLRRSLDEARLPHAFLFCGSRGVGKTTTARILARAVNCEQGMSSSPCGSCSSCRMILDGSASDVIELDAASHNGVDEVRALREQAGYAPLKTRRKVFILDEVHMFSRSAFNALLKILEEPPEHVLFILATTEIHKVPETVRSRCQVLPFRRIREADIRQCLARITAWEGVTVKNEILAEIAAASMGGLRDAETALERLLPLADGLDLDGYRRLEGRLGVNRAADLIAACLKGDASKSLGYANEAVETGVDERDCLGEILDVLRLLFLLRVDGKDSMLVQAEGEWRQRLLMLSQKADPVQLDAMMQILVLARDRIRHLDDRRVLLELSLVRLARVGELVSMGELELMEQGSPRRPQVAEPPAPAPATAGREEDEEMWSRIIQTVLEDRKTVLGNVLDRARLTWEGKTRLSLSFPPLSQLHRDLLARESIRTYLAGVVSNQVGLRVKLEIHILEESPDVLSPLRAGAAEEAPRDPHKDPRQQDPGAGSGRSPLENAVTDLFGAHPIKQVREKPPPGVDPPA
ncbi:MAG: DNA polymerase III subunit gamma/tau [Planctomycetota bacterium]